MRFVATCAMRSRSRVLSSSAISPRGRMRETGMPSSRERRRRFSSSSVRIAVHGPYQVKGGTETLAKGGELPWVEVKAGDTLSIGGTLFKETPVTIVPEEDGSIEVEYSRDARGNPVKPAGVRYKGTLIVHLLPDRKLALVNEIDLEEYLKGVVGKEMNLSEGVEALQTQIIAARPHP